MPLKLTKIVILLQFPTCRGGGTGRRGRLKICWWQHRESSSLSLGTLNLGSINLGDPQLRRRTS